MFCRRLSKPVKWIGFHRFALNLWSNSASCCLHRLLLYSRWSSHSGARRFWKSSAGTWPVLSTSCMCIQESYWLAVSRMRPLPVDSCSHAWRCGYESYLSSAGVADPCLYIPSIHISAGNNCDSEVVDSHLPFRKISKSGNNCSWYPFYAELDSDSLPHGIVIDLYMHWIMKKKK